jgi:hypothetical protein
VEEAFANRMSVASPATAAYVLLALPYLYVTVAALVLQVYAGGVIGVRPLSLRELVAAIRASALAYVSDLRAALGGKRAPAQTGEVTSSRGGGGGAATSDVGAARINRSDGSAR